MLLEVKAGRGCQRQEKGVYRFSEEDILILGARGWLGKI